MYAICVDKKNVWTNERQQEAEEEIIQFFCVGLKRSLRPYVAQKYETLAQAINAAREAESNDEFQNMLRQQKESQASSNGYNNKKKTSNNEYRKKDNTSKPEGQARPTLSPEERDKAMEQGLCFYCKTTGHRAKDCPEKVKKIIVNNINARDNSGDEDDTDGCPKNYPSGSQRLKAVVLKMKN